MALRRMVLALVRLGYPRRRIYAIAGRFYLRRRIRRVLNENPAQRVSAQRGQRALRRALRRERQAAGRYERSFANMAEHPNDVNALIRLVTLERAHSIAMDDVRSAMLDRLFCF